MSFLSKIAPFIGFLLLPTIISCKNDEAPEAETIEDEITADSNILENGVPESDIKNPLTITPDGSENYLNFDSEYIFDQESLHTFDLVLSEENLNLLNADPTAEEYVQGMLIFENDTLSPVGIRYKGSIGAFVGCVDGPNWLEPSGAKICTKLSMKIKINWEGKSEKFYGLKKLQFHSMNNDDSQMHERVGYWLFRQMGVPAPRAVHARLNINGIY
ncbi:MAG: CotH kinase family protein, partial [Cyclobacteriaceae bacterium]